MCSPPIPLVSSPRSPAAKDTKPLEMHFPRLTCTRGPAILLWVLVLAWTTAGREEELWTTQQPEEDTEGGWKVSRFFWKTMEPVITKAREGWNWIRTPGPVRGYLQTYYEDHLSGMSLRAQNWLNASQQKARSLCPRRFCPND